MGFISIKEIFLHSGAAIDLQSDITVLVGPNNSGKSTVLRETFSRFTQVPYNGPNQTDMVNGLEILRDGTLDDFLDELQLLFPDSVPGADFGYSHEKLLVRVNRSDQIPASEIQASWSSPTAVGRIGHYIGVLLGAAGRLELAQDGPSYDLLNELPSTPLQQLVQDLSLFDKLDLAVQNAFGIGLTLNRYSGSTLHIHVGKTVVAEDVSNPEFIDQLKALPLLGSQGDGMRAYVGILLAILSGRYSLILLDEPEAFLHPPQARRLGRFLAAFAQLNPGNQIVIATHSEDFLAGIASESSDSGLSVVRLSRTGDSNEIVQLRADEYKSTFDDPLVKYFGLYKGMFSSSVVLCESDSDCTYYRAAAETRSQLTALNDAHFIHTSGKARMQKALSALRKLNVPIAAIFDIDLLNDLVQLRRIIDLFALDSDFVMSLRERAVGRFDRGADLPRRSEVASLLERILVAPDEFVSKQEIDLARDAIRYSPGGWRELKKHGEAALTDEELVAFKSLVDVFENVGVFLLTQGELESLHTEIGVSNKAKWLQLAIEQKSYENSPAMPMLERVDSYLKNGSIQSQ